MLNLSSPVSVPGANNRSFLLDSMTSILDGHIRRKVSEYIKAHMPPKGDTQIKIADQALAHHGLYLKRVYEKFDKPSGVVYNLLQLQKCQMVPVLDMGAE